MITRVQESVGSRHTGAGRQVARQWSLLPPLFLTLVVSCVLLSSCSSSRYADFYVIDSGFATAAEAFVSPTVKRGWLPKGLLIGATNIRERHSVDTNEVWARWQIQGAEVPKLLGSCVSLTVTREDLPTDPNKFRGEPQIDWWEFESQSKEPNVRFLRTTNEPKCFLAVNIDTGTVFFWRLSG